MKATDSAKRSAKAGSRKSRTATKKNRTTRARGKTQSDEFISLNVTLPISVIQALDRIAKVANIERNTVVLVFIACELVRISKGKPGEPK